MGRKERKMATKESKTAENALMEDPADLVTEETKAPKAAKQAAEQNAMAKRIAELEAQLEAAQQLNAAYTNGDDYSVVQQKAQEAAENNVDPFTVMVSIRVPARRDSNDKYYWFDVNGRTVQLVADNKVQEMRLPFAEALVNMIRAEEHAQHFADEEIQVYDPVTNPHEKEEIRK